MREAGLKDVSPDKSPRTTRPAPETDRPADLVDRDFTASRPNELWVADLTYVRTGSGWVYVAFVLDIYSRMIVGWQISTNMYDRPWRRHGPVPARSPACWPWPAVRRRSAPRSSWDRYRGERAGTCFFVSIIPGYCRCPPTRAGTVRP